MTKRMNTNPGHRDLGEARQAGVRQGALGVYCLVQGDQGRSDTDLGKSVPGRGSSECKGPEAGWDLEIGLKCWAHSKRCLIGFLPPILQQL